MRKNRIEHRIAKQGIIKRFFTCWHLGLSLPRTTKNTTYQFCLKCGMRREYDMNAFRSVGTFYSPPIPEKIYYA